MLNFTYYNPVRIHFGKGQISKVAAEISTNSRVLVVYGGGSIKKNGVYDQVIKALAKHTIFEFSGIEANPQYQTCIKAVNVIKQQNIDFVLAVGGGSVIDAVKFIVAAAKYEGQNPWDILDKGAEIKEAIPFGTVLTLPATGSEMNCGSVISRAEIQSKRAFGSDKVYPQFSILDPETTYTLPPRQVANGVIDAFVHVMEQYLTYPVDAKVQDRLAEGILLTLIEEGQKVLKQPDNYDVRANIMWAAAMALNGLIRSGMPQDWATHMIGHELTALYGLDHAQTLAIVLPSIMSYKSDKKKEKLLQYADRVWNINTGSDEEIIAKAITKTREFFETMGNPTHISGYEIANFKVDAVIDNLQRHHMLTLGEHQDIALTDSRKIIEACI
ncbi:MAG: iron-containing alcohol dehydrogenase [Francisellaceae bacterium]